MKVLQTSALPLGYVAIPSSQAKGRECNERTGERQYSAVESRTMTATQAMSRASVALCAYNGGRFLREQLRSITEQSTPPCQLVICDDGSTDDTVAIADSFARSAPFPVEVRRNRTRLGTGANFDEASSRCSGDVIFLCDQDDVWHPEKITRTIERFDDPRVQCVFTDARLVDEEGRQIGRTLWQQIGFD